MVSIFLLMIFVVTISSAIASVFLGILSFIQFDRALRIQYRNHPETWRKDGAPIGFFFIPKDKKTLFSSSLARSSTAMKWLRKNPPQWARDSECALAYIKNYRRLSLAATRIVIFSFLLLLLSFFVVVI